MFPLTLKDAKRYIAKHHRHHGAPQGGLFAIGCAEDGRACGCIVVGRPIPCSYQDGWTAEVTRCCTDGTKNAPSCLYAASWRACRALGYRRLITYIRKDEPGTSLEAAGWTLVGERKARSWEKESGRPRLDKTESYPRLLWEVRS